MTGPMKQAYARSLLLMFLSRCNFPLSEGFLQDQTLRGVAYFVIDAAVHLFNAPFLCPALSQSRVAAMAKGQPDDPLGRGPFFGIVTLNGII
jgi:hypothetical protein